MSRYTFMPTHRAVPTSYVLTTYERRLIAQHYAKVARQARRATHDALHPSPGTGARKPGFVHLIDSDAYWLILGALLALDVGFALMAVQ